MEPEIIVPNLEGFDLKPYVSYRTKEINTPEFTAKSLFDKVYAADVMEKVMREETVDVKVDENEILDAKLKALRPNSDMLEPDRDELNYFTSRKN